MCVLLASTGGGYTGIYAVEHGQKMVKLDREQATTNVLGKIFDILPEMITVNGDDDFVATANRTDCLNTWIMFLFGLAREHPASHLQNLFWLHFHFPTRLVGYCPPCPLSDITIRDGFVAIAGLFEYLDDVGILTCQGTCCKPLTESVLTSFGYCPPVLSLTSPYQGRINPEGERACNSRTGNVNGKIQNCRPDTIIRSTLLLLVQPYSEKGCNYVNFAE